MQLRQLTILKAWWCLVTFFFSNPAVPQSTAPDRLVSSRNTSSVKRYDGRTGTFESNFITGFQNVEGFVFGADSLIYLCDWSANQVKRYDRSGAFVDIFARDGNLRAPNSVVFFPADKPTSVGSKDEPVPNAFALEQNYPNPFNPSTTISYELPQTGKVVLKIYNVLGEVIRTLVNEEQSAGLKSVVWNGTDDTGQVVRTGTYVYELKVAEFSQKRKMVFIK